MKRMTMKKNTPYKYLRNPHALPALMRKAGPHADSRKKRGKDQNWQRDWRDEINEDDEEQIADSNDIKGEQ